jgi:presenilin-like A22 family membrane protease
MLLLFWVGAVMSAYLGYRMNDWWVPAAVAVVVAMGQLALFQLGTGDRGPSVQLLGFGVMNLVMFHATFGIGRAIGQRLARRRKGAR